ncbi:MAG: alpha/beta hydrolase [Dehalococcoidia bacterium]
MVTVRKGYVDAPTGQVHYRDTLDGIPIVLLHQSPHSSRMFTAAFEPLAERGIRAIAMDTPGFGMSDVPVERPSIDTYASVIPSLMDALGIDACAVLGHHTGASIAIAFALAHPQRLRGLILNSPPVYDAERIAERLSHVERGPRPIHEDGSHFLRSWEGRKRATPGWTNLAAMHRSVVDTLANGDTAWYGHLAVYEYPNYANFLQLAGPAFILTNTGDDVYPWSKKAHELRPDFEYQELEGGTHDIVDEQPEAWADAVSAYVKKMAAAPAAREA